ncbi:Metallo-dependent phosphatase-like protein [Crucibulum laeve]|uniref:Metallo-dependent phosphatase-like protein n=1 Tax=Crucibulum laeve TaxID=68775 RepID=A0A5C3M2K7_9AGAR|nr:Metallo-dependent phosphatase-like protein [Crucibulum laeve]
MACQSTGWNNYNPKSIHTPTSIIYLHYSDSDLPPKPSDAWTRFVCISDTHSHTFNVPEGDVLLHSGDITNAGQFEEFDRTITWLAGLKHQKKIIIGGNHDLPLHNGWYQQHFEEPEDDRISIMDLLTGDRALQAGIIYLCDEKVQFRLKDGGREWSVYGSPWSPEFGTWAFGYPRSLGSILYSKFPQADILLTHTPAQGIFDRTNDSELVGCCDLRAHLLRERPILHVAGHIHEGRGAYVHDWDVSAEPVVQNDNEDLSDNSEDDDGNDKDKLAIYNDTEAPQEIIGKDGHRRTTFINASTMPSGRYTWLDKKLLCGGDPGWQAIVVDVLD